MDNASLFVILAKIAESIAAAQDYDQYSATVKSLAGTLNFDAINIAINKKSGREFMTDPTVTSLSEQALLDYDRDRWFERDPALAHALWGNGPLLWTPKYWKQQKQDEYYGLLVAAGISFGLTIPLNIQNRNLTNTFSAIQLNSLRPEIPDMNTAYAAQAIGEFLVARAVALGIADRTSDEPIRLKSLTSHQKEVLRWMAKGKSNAEIAIILDLSTRTVNYHVSEILTKLGVENRVQAAAIYLSR